MKGGIVIPYIRGTSESVKRITEKYRLWNAFYSRTTIGNM